MFLKIFTEQKEGCRWEVISGTKPVQFVSENLKLESGQNCSRGRIGI